MPNGLDFEVRVYAAMAAALMTYEDELEVEGALNWRDAIEERLHAGETPSPETSHLLAEADAALIRASEVLVRRFPDLFHPQRKANIPRQNWWWHLDEGSQVRKHPEQVA
ncbi:hypothetical protein NET02_03180 [Thermomicrobiaceae bacterium CFH 74404]|uniref:Uncharacterized protein n=1 Tax=Thermalbibacter longus TaxID=2951981 RepID=A0AA41W9Y1_9BACT|nr:hypothetical protein [Thermalbibacter longus]MCM8748137.1 hypothetical protein [Thermalbibacter longus]